MPAWWEDWEESILRTTAPHNNIYTPDLANGGEADVSHRPDSIPHLSQQQSQGSGGSPPGAAANNGPTLHPAPSQGAQSASPVKEPSILQRGMSVDEQESEAVAKQVENATEEKGVPIGQ